MLEAVKLISEFLKKRIVGPGAQQDLWASDSLKKEFLSSPPQEFYICGKLFPSNSEESQSAIDRIRSIESNNESEVENISDDFDLFGLGGDYDEDDNHEVEDADGETKDEIKAHKKDVQTSEINWAEKFEPNYMGCTFCMSQLGKIKLTFEYGVYRKAKYEDMHLKMTQDDYNCVKACREALGLDCDLEKWFNYQDGILSWKLNPEDSNTEPFAWDLMTNKPLNYEQSQMIKMLHPMRRYKSFYTREHVRVEHEIELSEGVREYTINLDDRCCAYLRIYGSPRDTKKKYVKISVKNKLKNHENGTKNTAGILYQTKLTVENLVGEFVPYTERIVNSIDSEYDQNQYIYRSECSYGIGDACALEWDDNHKRIWTTAHPEVDVKRYTRVIEGADDYQEIFKLHNLSMWSDMEKDEVIGGLRKFAAAYASWHEGEKNSAPKEDISAKIHSVIVEKQSQVVQRLNENIEYLNENDEAWNCFKLANTAMLMQMIIARDPDYQKNRDISQFPTDNTSLYNDIEEFNNKGKDKYAYYPFQLAFMLMNIRSTFENDDESKDIVDLIWFPTGGGKTEAYLALTALVIIARRRRHRDNNGGDGVAVIMRYTLRLLTSQQFERASYLICALQFLHMKNPKEIPGGDITAGLWLGGGVTPNNVRELNDGNFQRFFNSLNEETIARNPMPIKCCPWCGCDLVEKNAQLDQNVQPNRRNRRQQNQWIRRSGYCINAGATRIKCINQQCCFNDAIPLNFIDEDIYNNPPTLLFATVDKVVQLSHNQGKELFAQDDREMPNLIIQDELHLISGALGTATGLYEDALNMLLSRNNHKMKIVASTATTRNTDLLIDRLYNRKASVFPAQGTSYANNFFSKVERQEENVDKKRHHIGFMPVGISGAESEKMIIANLLIARKEYIKAYLKEHFEENGIKTTIYKEDGTISLNHAAVYDCIVKDNELISEVDDYWTLLCYYNSMKDVSRTASRISNDIENKVHSLSCYDVYSMLTDFVLDKFYNRKSEFTSRVDSHEIKQLLTDSEKRIKCEKREDGTLCVDGKDIILATNMISVGLDISRFNIMYMAGQPRAVAEYIQSSSRVARSRGGIVVNALSPMRAREKSIFEDYTAFHNVYYKYVEPLSITPYTIAAIDKLIYNVIGCYVYQNLRTTLSNLHYEGSNYINNKIAPVKEMLKNKVQDEVVQEHIENVVKRIVGEINTYNFGENNAEIAFRTEKMMNALRDIDPNVFYELN